MKRPAKIIFSILIAFLLTAFTVGGVRAADATLELSPSSGTIKNGETLNVDIMVNTGGADVGAVDAYLSFDADKFEVTLDDTDSAFDVVRVHPDAGPGEMDVSTFLASGEDSVTGSALVAILEVKAKADSGTGSVTLNFTPGATGDCNVIEQDTLDDILSSVTDGSYTLAAGDEPTPTPTVSPTPTPEGDGDSGDEGDSGDDGDEAEATPTPTTVSESSETKEAPDTGISEFSTFFALLGASLLFSGLLLVF